MCADCITKKFHTEANPINSTEEMKKSAIN